MDGTQPNARTKRRKVPFFHPKRNLYNLGYATKHKEINLSTFYATKTKQNGNQTHSTTKHRNDSRKDADRQDRDQKQRKCHTKPASEDYTSARIKATFQIGQ